MKKMKYDMFACVVFCVFFVVFFWDAIFEGKYLLNGDPMVTFYPLRVLAWNMVKQNILPLWTPHIFSGYPLLSMAQLGIFYPFTWGYLFLPGQVAEQAHILIPYLLCPLFTYLYVRGLGQSRIASILAGLSYGYGGTMISGGGMNGCGANAALWLPLILLGIDQAVKDLKIISLLVTTTAFTMLIFQGWGQGMAYVGCLAVIYGGYRSVFPLSKAKCDFKLLEIGRWWPLIIVITSGALASGLAAFQIIETRQAQSLSVRATSSYEAFSSGSYSPGIAWRSIVEPIHYGGDMNSYIPAIVIIFILIAVVSAMLKGRQMHDVIFWATIAVFAFILTMGSYTPLHRLIFYVPVLNLFRAPYRHCLELTFAASILGSLGLDALLSLLKTIHKVPSVKDVIRIAVCTLMIFTVWFCGRQWVQHSTLSRRNINYEVGELDPTYIGWKCGIALLALFTFVYAARIYWPWMRNVIFVSVLVLACYFEPFIGLQYFIYPTAVSPERFNGKYSDPTEFIRNHNADAGRVYSQVNFWRESYSVNRKIDGVNSIAMSGIQDVNGYDPLVLARYSRALNAAPWDILDASPTVNHNVNLFSSRSKVLDVLNTKYATSYANLGYDPVELHIKDDIAFSSSNIGVNISDDLPLVLDGTGNSVDTLALVTSMVFSTHVPNGLPVAKVTAYSSNGDVIETYLRAGIDTSEWAHERVDVKANVKHSLAPIYESYPGDNLDSFKANRYIARFELGKQITISKVEIKRLVKDIGLSIFKASLYDSATRQTYQLPGVPSSRWKTVYDKNGVIVMENLRALPRAWLVTRAEALDEKEILARLKGNSPYSFDAKTTALVEMNPKNMPSLSGASLSSGSYARILKYEPNRLLLETDSDQRAMLVVSEINYPGWVATVDGEKTPIHQTNYLLRGMFVPAGKHKIEMKYTAPGFQKGVIISFMTLMVLSGLVFYDRRRHKR